MGFSQSTVSFQIKQLETELNSQLFERINHTVVLTEKGREVLSFAHQINKMTQELKDNIQDEKKDDEGIYPSGNGRFVVPVYAD